MREAEDLRQRMIAAGVDLPAEIIDMVVIAAGPMVTSLEDLVALAPEGIEPFTPARRLPDDAAG